MTMNKKMNMVFVAGRRGRRWLGRYFFRHSYAA